MTDYQVKEANYDDPDFVEFMTTNAPDIFKYFPHYSDEDAEYGEILVLTYQDEIIGAFVYTIKGNEIHVETDYLIEEYRDQGIGKSFFENRIKEYQKEGISLIVALTNNDVHVAYLKDIGFKPSPLYKDRFELQLNSV